ncbi:helix-turn-helix transcriptional regulator [Paludibacterium yongneupense]|uniref:helix-turn-helix transcriptional regulator n=1 Tax=Paludibacterium yongneupense TaxID=400061 RepID=UPI000419F295|nr:PAS domain-containing protein [Paludibacterium yongneupense]
MRATVDLEVLASFLAEALGSHTEVVIHDLSDLEHSLCLIRNPISRREVGAPATDLALRMLRECDGTSRPYRTNYNGKTLDGRQFRSSSLVVRDTDGTPRAMICLNSDDRRLRQVIESLQSMITADDAPQEELLSGSIEQVGDEMINLELSRFELPAHGLGVDEKRELVQRLDRNGLFLVKGFIAKTAGVLGISEPTLYRYLKD